MQLFSRDASRRAGALKASVLTVAAAGFVGAGAVFASTQNDKVDAVDQQTLIGKQAPDFTLTDLEGKEHTLSTYTKEGKIVVLEWFNPDCPFVVKHYANDNDTMIALAKKYSEQNVVWLAINSGHEGNSTADKDRNLKAHKDWGMQHPILRDLDGTVGKAYGAVTTPNMYIIDSKGILQYAGAIDNDSRAAKPGDVNYVKDALKAVLAGETVATSFAKPYGCSVKYGKN
jgi:peroxiredoxin